MCWGGNSGRMKLEFLFARAGVRWGGRWGHSWISPPWFPRSQEKRSGDQVDHQDLSSASELRSEIRLPTASTCFNLLKLPNYQKKATLKVSKWKLKYFSHTQITHIALSGEATLCHHMQHRVWAFLRSPWSFFSSRKFTLIVGPCRHQANSSFRWCASRKRYLST